MKPNQLEKYLIQRTGLHTPDTVIRNWETQRIIAPVPRKGKGRERNYAPENVAEIEIVNLLTKIGLSQDIIKELLTEKEDERDPYIAQEIMDTYLAYRDKILPQIANMIGI